MVSHDRNEITSIENIDTAYLTSLLHEAGYAGTELIGFSCEPVAGDSFGGGSLHRFQLQLAPGAPEGIPISLILKEARSVKSQAQDPGYSRREAECYRADIFARLGARLLVPKTYRTEFHEAEDYFWIWLEDYGEAFELAWNPKTLALAVRDLAELHAVWWERRTEWEKLSFLRPQAHAMYDGLWGEWIATNLAAIARHPQVAEIGQVFTPMRQEQLLRLSRAADWVYPYLDRLPQTLLHHDVWLPNIGRRGKQTVLIDWSYIGPGTPGSDLSQTGALLAQAWIDRFDEGPLLEALYAGLTEDWQLPISYDQVVAGYEIAFCLRPAHALGGPVLKGILQGGRPMVGSEKFEDKLAASELIFQRIERGLQRLAA